MKVILFLRLNVSNYLANLVGSLTLLLMVIYDIYSYQINCIQPLTNNL